MKTKKLLIILSIVILLLLIPLIAMQFTDEVNWTLSDFVIGGALLFGTGFMVDLAIRKTINGEHRTWIIISIIVVFLLIWAELAVGIFGTPFAGN
jgi:ABC-type cobalt transport system substrate-binding protein